MVGPPRYVHTAVFTVVSASATGTKIATLALPPAARLLVGAGAGARRTGARFFFARYSLSSNVSSSSAALLAPQRLLYTPFRCISLRYHVLWLLPC